MLLIAPTSDDIEKEVIGKVKKIVRSVSIGIETTVFGSFKLKRLHKLLERQGKRHFISLLNLKGYSNIRNLCLLLSHLLGSDTVVLVDDDEVFEDADFASKIRDFIGTEYGGKNVDAVAGYYLQPDGDYHVKRAARPWMRYWGQCDKMNEVFDMVIGGEPRLKETPFVFGGNMVIHRNLFSRVPFDPGITRGEDIDYLVNARMFGFTFFLDNQLSIKHLPPPKAHPAWMQLRQDIYRFIYERAKIENQKEIQGMTKVYARDFDPYPGYFLKENLEEMIEATCQLLSREYMAQGDRQGREEALRSIALAKIQTRTMQDPFISLCRLQKSWQKLMEYMGNNPPFIGIVKQ